MKTIPLASLINPVGVALEHFEETTNLDLDYTVLVKVKRILITQIHMFQIEDGVAVSKGTGAA